MITFSPELSRLLKKICATLECFPRLLPSMMILVFMLMIKHSGLSTVSKEKGSHKCFILNCHRPNGSNPNLGPKHDLLWILSLASSFCAAGRTWERSVSHSKQVPNIQGQDSTFYLLTATFNSQCQHLPEVCCPLRNTGSAEAAEAPLSGSLGCSIKCCAQRVVIKYSTESNHLFSLKQNSTMST